MFKSPIEVDSTKGQGTTFTIFFPASTADIPEAQIMETAEQVLKGTESILLVDDEEPVLDASEQMIKALGYTVSTAKSGLEAVEIYRSNNGIV